MSPTAARMAPKCGAMESRIRPAMLKAMPAGSAKYTGRRSVYRPTSGCNSEAVSWPTSVMMPIWLKSSP